MGYSWVNKGSASGLSFVLGNNVYEYDSINNLLVRVADSKPTRTRDLMFVLNDLNNITIDNNSFIIYVNHYKLK